MSKTGIFCVLSLELADDELLDAVALEAKATEISKSGAKYISIDLSSLDYIYSDSINKFIGINRSFISIFGRLVLVAPHQKVFEILCRAGADKQMKIVRSFEELQMLSDILAGNPADVEVPKTVPEKTKFVDDFSDLKQILSDTLNIGDDLPAKNDFSPRFSEDSAKTEEKLDEIFNENKVPAEPEVPKAEQVPVQTPKKQDTGFVPSEEVLFDTVTPAPEKQTPPPASDTLSDTVAEKPKKFITVGQNPPPDLDLYYYEEPSDEAKEILYRRNRSRRRRNKLPKFIFIFIIIVSAVFAALVFTGQISIDDIISMFAEQQQEVEPEIIEPEFKEEARFEIPAQTPPPVVPAETKRVSPPAQKPTGNTQKQTSNTQKAQNKSAQTTNKSAQTAVSDIIEIYTFPAGAAVFVNGAHYGKTPANIQNLPYGNVSIRVESPDFEPYVWNIKYDGGNKKLTKNLDRKVEIRGQSAQPVRQSAAQQSKQQAQTQTQTQPSVQQSQPELEQAVEVKPVEAIISFSSNPPGAEIFENGVFVGKANGTPFKTTPGEHNYEFRKDDRTGKWTGRLRDGKNQSQLVRLE